MSYPLIETKELPEHRIQIFHDECPECPVTSWDMAGFYLWEYSDFHRLSRECDYKELFGEYGKDKYSLCEALQRLVCNYVDMKHIMKYLKDSKKIEYDRSRRVYVLGYFEFEPSDIQSSDLRFELTENLEKKELIEMLSKYAKDLVIHEWSTRGYSQGDYVEGFAYITEERFKKRVDANTKNWKKRASELFEGEEKCIGMWMWGDVKGFTLEKKVPYTKVYNDKDREDEECFDWEEIDSCWGYYMETDELIEEVMSEHDLKEVA